jgi:hypothetical protein
MPDVLKAARERLSLSDESVLWLQRFSVKNLTLL